MFEDDDVDAGHKGTEHRFDEPKNCCLRRFRLNNVSNQHNQRARCLRSNTELPRLYGGSTGSLRVPVHFSARRCVEYNHLSLYKSGLVHDKYLGYDYRPLAHQLAYEIPISTREVASNMLEIVAGPRAA